MALTSTNTIAQFGFSRGFSKLLDGLVRWFEARDEQRSAPYRLRIARLHALSDSELKAMNLRRENIEVYVLSRFFYC